MGELQVWGGAISKYSGGERPREDADVVLRPHHACTCPPCHTYSKTNKQNKTYDKEKEKEAPERK